MHHRSHDREALDCSIEPGLSLGPGSTSSPENDLSVRLHEAANWLAVLRGHVDLATRRQTVEPELGSALRRAVEGLERAIRGDAETSTVDVGRLAREVGTDARTLRPGLDLFVDAPPEGALVGTTDPQALRDILLNLIKNAAEAFESGGGGHIRVSVQPSGSAAFEFVVEDDGPGMAPEVRERCFEAGFSTKAATGRGMGLARVAELAGRLGAWLGVRSRPETGTRFVGTVPLGAAVPSTRSASVVGPLPERVLVVDDDPDVSGVLVEMLHALGVEGARGVTDPRGVVGLCRGRSWDVVFLDRDLGTTQGDRLAIEVRQVDPAVAIVLLTGDPVLATDAPRGALDMAMTKPIGLDALRRRLQEAVRLTRSRRSGGSEEALGQDG